MARAQSGRTAGNDKDNTVKEGEKAVVGVMADAQQAAGKLLNQAEKAAEQLPEVMSEAQAAARDTQRALEGMPNQTLALGAAFSFGMAVGLFLTGTNRLLVLAALAPAAAMAATLLGRQEDGAKPLVSDA
jgi:ElaB/YqjD/DUF883 family membrane-anchored ribosome-binding protein